MGSIWLNDSCHYCGKKAESVDHIVPRMLLPKPLSKLPMWYRWMNEIPACKKCNGEKGCKRGTCFCKACVTSWVTAKNCGFIRPLSIAEVIELREIDPFYEEYLYAG